MERGNLTTHQDYHHHNHNYNHHHHQSISQSTGLAIHEPGRHCIEPDWCVRW